MTLEAPREDLIRMTDSLRSEDDGNTLVGYAAVFNDWTEIDSWEGRFFERLDPKAFNKTLADRSDQVKVLFNHGMDPQIGDKPLGKPRTMQPDRKGLRVEVPLDDTSYNRDIKALLRSGALDGMSFRMSVLGEEWVLPDASTTENPEKLPERTITQVRLYEFGPVTFPAYSATTAGVRAHAPRAFEAWRQMTGAPVVPTSPAADQPSPDDEVETEPVDGPDTSTRPDEPSEPASATRERSAGDDATGARDDPTDRVSLPSYAPARRRPKDPARRYADREFLRAISADITSRSA